MPAARLHQRPRLSGKALAAGNVDVRKDRRLEPCRSQGSGSGDTLAFMSATLPLDRAAAEAFLLGRINYERDMAVAYRERNFKLDRMRDLDLMWLGRYYVAKDPRAAFKYVTPMVDGKRKVTEAQKTEAVFIIGQGLRAINKLDLAIQSFKEVEALGHGYGLLARLETARRWS